MSDGSDFAPYHLLIDLARAIRSRFLPRLYLFHIERRPLQKQMVNDKAGLCGIVVSLSGLLLFGPFPPGPALGHTMLAVYPIVGLVGT